MQVTLMRLMSKGEYLIVPKGTKFKGSGKLGLNCTYETYIKFKEISMTANLRCKFKYQTYHENFKYI